MMSVNEWRKQALCAVMALCVGLFAASNAHAATELPTKASKQAQPAKNAGHDQDEEQAIDNDPLEPVNRAIYEFNYGFDIVLLKPVTQGYRFIVPEYGRTMFDNFITNLYTPVVFANSVFQADPQNSFATFWRFMLNTTIGMGGVFDVASEAGLHNRPADLGETFAFYGAGAGPYIVLPIIGPSNLRDMFGRIGDAFMIPTNYAGKNWIEFGVWGATAVNERSHHTVRRIVEETKLKPAAHLTCVNASRGEVDQVARDYWQAGVRHIVALRGDPPQGMASYVPHEDGYRYSCELVAGLKRIADFEISVAAFPEKHPDSPSFEADIEYLKMKINAGATRAITQYFFDVDLYFRFVERVRKAGITIPIVPGILPISNFAQVRKFSAMCGASVPGWLEKLFDSLDENPAKRNAMAIQVAADQCQKLLAGGVTQLHFYTLNRADLVECVCAHLR